MGIGARFALVLFGVTLTGATPLFAARSGLPFPGTSESALYQRADVLTGYREVAPGDVKPNQYYLAWSDERQRYVWISGKDRLPIHSSSIAQGWRFGYTNGRWDWFLLVPSPYQSELFADWSMLPAQPCVEMDQSDLGRRDCPANGWNALGELGCHLRASPSKLALGEALTLTWDVTGPADHLFIDGEQKEIAERRGMKIVPNAIGSFDVRGTVDSGPYRESCAARYEVVAPQPPPPPSTPSTRIGCKVEVMPKLVPVGAAVMVSIELEGKVEKIYLDQKRIDPHLLKQLRVAPHVGYHPVLVKVIGANHETATCWDLFKARELK